MMHFPSDTGFALGALESIFFEAAVRVEGTDRAVHFAYPKLGSDGAPYLPSGFRNLVECHPRLTDRAEAQRLRGYVRANRIERVFAFDLGPGSPSHRVFRDAGVRRVVAYIGAPMGSPRGGMGLWVRQVWTALQSQADHYVFESVAMQESGVLGRGLSLSKTSVVRTGLDCERFHPRVPGGVAKFESLGIPLGRRVVFYTGHMEARKGVAVIVRAAIHLVDDLGRSDVHFVLCGDRPGEKDEFLRMLTGTTAIGHVTFGGYRNDIPELMAASSIGVIASTGWDSFPRSAMEMSASGLPLVASELQGLKEAVVPGETGVLFTPGDHVRLATILNDLLSNDSLRTRMSLDARRMATRRYSRERQIQELANVMGGDAGTTDPRNQTRAATDRPSRGRDQIAAST